MLNNCEIKLQFGNEADRPRLPHELYQLEVSVCSGFTEPKFSGVIEIDTKNGKIFFIPENSCIRANIFETEKYNCGDRNQVIRDMLEDNFKGESYFDVADQVYELSHIYPKDLTKRMEIILIGMISHFESVPASLIWLDPYTGHLFHVYVVYALDVLEEVWRREFPNYEFRNGCLHHSLTRVPKVSSTSWNHVLYNTFSNITDQNVFSKSIDILQIKSIRDLLDYRLEKMIEMSL